MIDAMEIGAFERQNGMVQGTESFANSLVVGFFLVEERLLLLAKGCKGALLHHFMI